jgi:hypothetical protein
MGGCQYLVVGVVLNFYELVGEIRAVMWTRVLNNNAVFTLGGFVRRDQYNYYPSGNLFDDLSWIEYWPIP